MPPMYVCLCHGFTDRDVRELARGGTRSAAQVYRHFGVRPQCGKCVPYVRAMVSEGDEGAKEPCGVACACG